MKPNLARDFFLHLLSTVVLYISLVSVLMIIFQIINVYIIDPTLEEYLYQIRYDDTARMGIAMLGVAFPIYAWSLWYIRKLIGKAPAIAQLRVRKWLLYLTIFVAAIILIITTISLFWSFLNGELTMRFTLKVLAVAGFSAAMFWYYLAEVREKVPGKQQKGVAIAVVVAVILSLIGGFFIAGSPGERRLERIDEERVSALRSISWEIDSHYSMTGELPEVLTDLDYAEAPADPETDEPYTYTVIDEQTYQLCATFARESYLYERTRDTSLVPETERWDHPAGEHCFDRTVEEVIKIEREATL